VEVVVEGGGEEEVASSGGSVGVCGALEEREGDDLCIVGIFDAQELW
jgi:hypothetical protein